MGKEKQGRRGGWDEEDKVREARKEEKEAGKRRRGWRQMRAVAKGERRGENEEEGAAAKVFTWLPV